MRPTSFASIRRHGRMSVVVDSGLTVEVNTNNPPILDGGTLIACQQSDHLMGLDV
jgi:hypothetical protein